MMRSAPVEHRYDTRHSRWRAAGRAHVRIRLLDLHSATPPIVSHNLQQARSPRPAHPCYTANRAQPPPPPNIAKPYPVAQSP